MTGYETEYLNTDTEGDLLSCILANLDSDTDSEAADRILCDLIEMGLCNPDHGPAVLAWWGQQEADDVEDLPGTIRKMYVTLVDGDD